MAKTKAPQSLSDLAPDATADDLYSLAQSIDLSGRSALKGDPAALRKAIADAEKAGAPKAQADGSASGPTAKASETDGETQSEKKARLAAEAKASETDDKGADVATGERKAGAGPSEDAETGLVVQSRATDPKAPQVVVQDADGIRASLIAKKIGAPGFAFETGGRLVQVNSNGQTALSRDQAADLIAAADRAGILDFLVFTQDGQTVGADKIK